MHVVRVGTKKSYKGRGSFTISLFHLISIYFPLLILNRQINQKQCIDSIHAMHAMCSSQLSKYFD